MRKSLLVTLFLVFGICFGQSRYTIQNFLAFSIINSSDFDRYMIKDGFEMIDSEIKENSMKLTYRTINTDAINIGLITVTKDLVSDSSLRYSFYNEEENIRLIKNIYDINYKLNYSDNKNGVLEKHYSKEDTTISIYKTYDDKNKIYMYMYSFSIKRDR